MRLQRTSLRPAPKPAQVRATVFQIQRGDADTSRQLEAIDRFAGIVLSGNGSIMIQPPYNVERLYRIVEQSNTLPQCIESYVTNIVMQGWEVGPLIRGKDLNEGEAHELQSFIDSPNIDETLISVMSKVRREQESVGFGYLEVIRDRMGRLSLLRHAKSLYTRMTTRHPEEVLVTYEIARGRRVTVVREFKRFRKFFQLINGEFRWFREFGDPRPMDYTTGAFKGEPGYRPGFDATEIAHFPLPSDEPYGVPRWISQLPSILGSRESEEVNMRYFQDNTVPPMMLLVGNGRLTQESHQELQRTLNSEGLGKDRQNKILLLEAVGESDSLDAKGTPIDLKIEKLTDARQSDGLFSAYDSANMGKVRSSFRLPPVLVGMSQDINYATAQTSVAVAESQVFAPERSATDDMLNRLLVNGPSGLGLKHVKLVSRTPAVTAPDTVVKTLTALNVMGAVTPRTAQAVANTMLQIEVGSYPKPGEKGYEEWMDMPLPVLVGERKTHAEQSLKTQKIKETEETGDNSPDVPKHGEE